MVTTMILQMDLQLEILRKLYDQIIKESMTSDYPTFANLNESLKMLDKAVKMVKIG